MVFFYAGHGSRVVADPGWLADGNMVETIVPHDEGSDDSEGNVIYGIPDRTFDGLMRELAFRKGDNIVRPHIALFLNTYRHLLGRRFRQLPFWRHGAGRLGYGPARRTAQHFAIAPPGDARRGYMETWPFNALRNDNRTNRLPL